MIIDFFASLSFYIVPYLTGRFFTKKVFQAWIIGAFIWFVAYFLVSGVFDVFKIGYFEKFIRFLAISISITSFCKLIFDFIKQRPSLNKTKFSNVLLGSALLVFASAIYFLIWKRNTPYPLALDWDMYEHVTLANQIVLGKLSFLTSHTSDTFTVNSYSGIFSILLSLPKIIFQRSLIGIYWWLEYWHYLLTILASFLLAKKVFNDKWMALVAAILASLVFESVMVYSGLFLIPQTLVALITVFVLQEIKEYKLALLIIAGAVIFLMHYVVGILCLAVLVPFYLSSKVHLSNKLLNAGIIASTLVLIGSIGLNYVFKLQLLGSDEAKYFNYTLSDKTGFFMDWYGIILFIFAPIGYLAILKTSNYGKKFLLIFALLTLAVSLAPFSYALKFFVLDHYLLNLVIVAGIGVFIANMPAILKILSVFWLSLVLLITFYKNQLTYKDPLHFSSYDTQLSYEEIQAGQALASYTKGQDALLISDPSLQYALEAASGVNTQGGVYMDLQTRKTLVSINSFYDTEYIKQKLLTVKDVISSENKPDEKVFFAVGGRYFAWQSLPEKQKLSTFYNIWSPQKISATDKFYIDFLAKSKQFKEVYKNDEIVIFEVI